MKKLSVILVLVTVFCANALVIPQTPQIGSDGCFLIANAEELYGFADEVNSGRTDNKTCVRLEADITINPNLLDSEKVAMAIRDTVDAIPPAPDCVQKGETCKLDKWTPIGFTEKTAFKGRFDGQGHTISGLFVNSPARDSVGFWGYVEGGVIENLHIVDTYIRGRYSVGGVIGAASYGRIYNCSFSGVVVSDGTAGGVVGKLRGTILHSHNDGYVRGGSSVGGVVGNANSSMVNKCYNTGAIFGDENVGGITGLSGNVMYSYNAGDVHANKYAAGLVGELFGPSDSVMYSFNIGHVYGSSHIVGEHTFSTSDYKNVRGNYSLNGAARSSWGDFVLLDSAAFRGDSLLNILNGLTFGLWKKGERHPVFDEAAKPELKDSVYQIKSAAQLLWFVDYENFMFAYPNTSAILLDDIVFNKNVVASECVQKDTLCDFPNWEPIFGISKLPDYYGFTGTFDGNGHSVSGLYMGWGSSKNPDEGMFRRIDNRGVVKNLVLTDSYFASKHLNIIAVENKGKMIECFGKYYRDGTIYSGAFGAEEYVIDFRDYGFMESYSTDNYEQKHKNNDGLWFDGKRFAVSKRAVCYYKDSTECNEEGHLYTGYPINMQYPRAFFPYKTMNPVPRFISRFSNIDVTMDNLGYLAYKYRYLVGDTVYARSFPKEIYLSPARYNTEFPDLEGVCMTYTSDHDMTFSGGDYFDPKCGIVLPKTNEPKTVNLDFKDFKKLNEKDTVDCGKLLRKISYMNLGHRDSQDIEGVARLFEFGPKGTCKGGKKIAAEEPAYCYSGVRDYCAEPDNPILPIPVKTVLSDMNVAIAGRTLVFSGVSAGATFDLVDVMGVVTKKGYVLSTIDVSEIKAGVYVVRVRDGAKRLVKKVSLR